MYTCKPRLCKDKLARTKIKDVKEAILFLAPDLRVGGRRLSFHALEDILHLLRNMSSSPYLTILYIFIQKNNIRGNFLLEKRKISGFKTYSLTEEHRFSIAFWVKNVLKIS